MNLNEKGFTLIELLAVLVIITIVGAIATVGVIAIRNSANENLLSSRKELIEESAILYGQDNKELLINSCILRDGSTNESCIVKKLSDISYIEQSDECDGVKCIKNDVTGESMLEDEIAIYIKNNRIYAEFVSIKSCLNEC